MTKKIDQNTRKSWYPAGRSGPAGTGEQVDTGDTSFDAKACINLCQPAGPDRLKQVNKLIQLTQVLTSKLVSVSQSGPAETGEEVDTS